VSSWPSKKGREVLAALKRVGWEVKRTTGSHRVLARAGSADVVFAFGDAEEIGPTMLRRIARDTGLTVDDLRK
jgi:predicted RNA binding protein YcfA (HicA-like mRNA interferase family)